MQSQRQTVTDRLADVIHIIHIGGKSGVLTVERGEGQAVEEGSITFVDGRVVEAHIGAQRGLTAFNYLNTWMTCRFSLVSQHTNEVSSSGYSGQLPPLVQRNNVPDKIFASHRTAPLRLQLGEETLKRPGTMQLPRLHRHLLLLVDGQRGSSDLARLMSRSADEIQELLNDLERSGLIQQ